MPNPLLSGMSTSQGSAVNPQIINRIKNMMQMVQGSQNPAQVLQNVAAQNPQLRAVMQMCQTGNPQQIFIEMCRQRGIDPNSILQALK